MMENAAHFLMNLRVKEILKESSITQAKLAEMLGLETGYISELLSKKEDKRWNIDHINGICENLNIHPWMLFMPQSEVDVILAYRRLSGTKKAVVDEFLDLSPSSADKDGGKNNPLEDGLPSRTKPPKDHDNPHKKKA